MVLKQARGLNMVKQVSPFENFENFCAKTTRHHPYASHDSELGLGTLKPRFVAWPLELGLGIRNPRFVAWPLELGSGTLKPRFVAWPLELGLGTHNPRFVAWPLELGLGIRNPRFIAWPLEVGLGTRNPRFVVWPLYDRKRPKRDHHQASAHVRPHRTRQYPGGSGIQKLSDSCRFPS